MITSFPFPKTRKPVEPFPTEGLTDLKVQDIPSIYPIKPSITAEDISGIESKLLPDIQKAYAPQVQGQYSRLQQALAESEARTMGTTERTAASRGLTSGGYLPAAAQKVGEASAGELRKGALDIETATAKDIRGELQNRLAQVLSGLQEASGRDWQAKMLEYQQQQNLYNMQKQFELQKAFEEWRRQFDVRNSLVYGGGLETPAGMVQTKEGFKPYPHTGRQPGEPMY